jgi:hypothetical protein
MELYTTKKLTSVDEFCLAPLDTLPSVHVITPEVVVQLDGNDNMFIADCPGDSACIPNLIKIKKLLCKQFYKGEGKLMDEILWVRPSPTLVYKAGSRIVGLNKIMLGRPIKLQLSCKSGYMYSMGKQYGVYNMFWSVDYVHVDENFDWSGAA